MSTPADNPPASSSARRGKWFGVTARKSVWSMIDQAVLSGGRFALTVLVGRLAGADELGLYAMGFSVLVIGLVTQESLLASPYGVLGNQGSERRQRRALGGMLAGWGGLVGISTVGLASVAVALSLGGTTQAALVGALALAWPGVMVHGLARRVAYAHLQPRSALVLDTAVSVAQIGLILGLAAAGGLSAEAALLSLGGAGLLGGLAWWWVYRGWVAWNRRAVRPWLWRSWRFGRWIMGSQQTRAVVGLVVTGGLVWVAGTETAGRYAAAALVAVAANPLVLGLGGVMEAKAARAWSAGGQAELRRVVRKVTAGVAVVMAGYVAVVAVVGGAALAWILDGPTYEGLNHAATVLAVTVAVRAIRIGWNNAVKAARRPQWSFAAGLVELVVVAVLIAPLGWRFGVEGAAYTLLAAAIVGTAIRWYAYAQVLRGRGTNR